QFIAQEASAGDNIITGFSDENAVEMGPGNDLFLGEAGAAAYTHRLGDGIDRIDDSGSGSDGPDRIVFADVNSDQVKFLKAGENGADLLIRVLGGQAGRMSVVKQFATHQDAFNQRIESFSFADGVTLSASAVEALIIAQRQTDRDDRLVGSDADNVFEGGRGDDHIIGGDGRDTYTWSAGDGRDLIENSGGADHKTDTLVLHGVLPDDVAVLRSPIDPETLEIEIGGVASEAVVLNHQASDFQGDHVERVVFDNGTVWTAADLIVAANGGYVSAVTIAGTAGSEFITGTQGNDVIDAGAGNDTIDSRYGSDLILYGVGYGNDTLQDVGGPYWRDADTLRLIDLNPADVELSRHQRTLTITVTATGETFTVTDQFNFSSVFP